MDNAKNFAKVTVSTGYDASAISVVLTGGHGVKLPTVPFNATWWNSTDYPDPSDDPNVEIVRVTNIATDTLTVTRAQESTSAATHNTGSKIYKMIAGLTALAANSLVDTGSNQTVSSAKTFNDSTLKLAGSTSGATTLKAPAAAGTDICTLPAGTNTLLANLVEDTTPQLGGDLDLNGHNIAHSAILTVDGTFQGEILTATVDTNAVGFGACLAQAADFHFDEADADAVANAAMLVLACETGTGTKKVLLRGQLCHTAWNWTGGLPIYLSVTQGTLVQVIDSTGTTDVTVIVGYPLNADTIYFNPYAAYVENV